MGIRYAHDRYRHPHAYSLTHFIRLNENIMTLKTLDRIKLQGKRVLLRADLNIPFNKNDQPQDITRIQNIIPTLNQLVEKKAIIIIILPFR